MSWEQFSRVLVKSARSQSNLLVVWSVAKQSLKKQNKHGLMCSSFYFRSDYALIVNHTDSLLRCDGRRSVVAADGAGVRAAARRTGLCQLGAAGVPTWRRMGGRHTAQRHALPAAQWVDGGHRHQAVGAAASESSPVSYGIN